MQPAHCPSRLRTNATMTDSTFGKLTQALRSSAEAPDYTATARKRDEDGGKSVHREQESEPLNVATELRVLEPCPEPCWLCQEYDDEDDPHPIVPGTTVGHCAKSRLTWHETHVCGPCQCAVDDVLAPRRLGRHQAFIFEDEPARLQALDA